MALILKDNPIIEPAATEKIYNVWWVENLSLDATLTRSPEPILVVDYRLCYLDANGKPNFHPTETRRLHIRDLFSYTATDENVYNTVWNAVDVLGNIGKSQGVLD
jgi:hypothetical protein